jgi:hypothetical protein
MHFLKYKSNSDEEMEIKSNTENHVSEIYMVGSDGWRNVFRTGYEVKILHIEDTLIQG